VAQRDKSLDEHCPTDDQTAEEKAFHA